MHPCSIATVPDLGYVRNLKGFANFNQFKIFNDKCHKMPNCNQQGGAAVLFMIFGVHGRKGFGPAPLKDSLGQKIVIV